MILYLSDLYCDDTIFSRFGEHLEENLPKLDSLIMTNNNIQGGILARLWFDCHSIVVPYNHHHYHHYHFHQFHNRDDQTLPKTGACWHRDAVLREDADDAVAAAQPGGGQAQLPPLRHSQVPQPQGPRLQEGQGEEQIKDRLMYCGIKSYQSSYVQ